MKAMILNSGLGTRMGPLTRNKPKCLVELKAGETILGRQLRVLQSVAVEEVIITTGPCDELIRSFTSEQFPRLNVAFVNNQKYESTNYIYSMHLTRERCTDDIILMHGDLVFDQALFEAFVISDSANAVIINNHDEIPDKDFKGRIENRMVTEIGIDVFGNNCYSLLPLYKFSKQAFDVWLNEINVFINNGNDKVYAENAFNTVADKIDLSPYYNASRVCMEVDNAEDLEIAVKRLGY
jgi:choline kinase